MVAVPVDALGSLGLGPDLGTTIGNLLFGGSGADPSAGNVVTGPLMSGTGAPIPFFSEERTQVYSSPAGVFTSMSDCIAANKGQSSKCVSSTRISKTPSGFFDTRTLEDAGGTFFQPTPGSEGITSFAPGAAGVQRDIAGGFLPDLFPGELGAAKDPGSPFMQIAIGMGLVVFGILLTKMLK